MATRDEYFQGQINTSLRFEDFLLCTYLIETLISPFPFGCLIYKDGNTISIFTIVFVEPVALSFSQRHAFLKVSLESFYTDTIIS